MTDSFTVEVHALFERVIDLGAEERAALLDRECAGRPELRAQVEALLAHDSAEHPILDAGAPALLELLEADAAPGRIGPYRIVRELGRGGMGLVYLAERSDPDLRVALKVIATPGAGQRMVERFRRERQILANLRHPNIARLFDGGVTDDGLPFLAMEYVAGQRIDAWCDERRASIEARLRLFLTACDAVNHAQRNLVVHRDLKPANILVSEEGEVKLLDFGIAKLLSDEDAAATHDDATVTLVHAFTPRYAAPEQVDRSGVGTATDVHALGVVLYELLTGTNPFPDTTSSFEAARAILEVEPQAPSAAAIAGNAEDVRERAALRGLTPDRLRRRLRGDLDAIVLKAMRKDPAERYPSAAALADDLRRHLDHAPVAARPDDVRYRVRKFVRRRRGLVAALLALILLTGAFTAVHTTRLAAERDRAELNAEKAGATRDFLLSLFTSNLPSENLGDTLTVADMLERGVGRADSLGDRPELRALLLATLGDVYRATGNYERAQPLVEQAVVEYRQLGTDPLGLSDALTGQAMLYFDLGRYEEAVAPTSEALAIQRRLLGNDDERVLSSLANMATLAGRTGDVEGSLRMNLELLERRRRLLGADDPSVAFTLNNIGFIHYREERLEQAESYFREALALRRRILPRQHPDLALSMNNLGAVLADRGNFDGAEEILREALAIRQDVLGPTHPSLAVSHYRLGRVLQQRGDPVAAVPHLRAALEIDRLAYGPDHPEVGADALVLTRALTEAGECLAVHPLLDDARRIFAAAADSARLVETEEAAAAAATACDS